jgi:hypothetical protein
MLAVGDFHDEHDDGDDEMTKETEKERVIALIRGFLEQHPLYASFRFKTTFPLAASYSSEVWGYSSAWPKSVTLRCERCKANTTWRLVEMSKKGGPDVPFEFFDHNYLLRYICGLCERESAAFWCSAGSDADRTNHVLRKQGQSPAWSIEPASAVAKALPLETVAFYKKGLICLSHNFGLAAVAYFRRVVEQVTGHILDLIGQTAKELGDQATVVAIAEAQRSHQATDRLKFAADKLPANLRPGGRNPLADLYDAYSEGIHALDDDECLDVALAMRATLDFLLPQLHDQLAAARAYQASLGKAKRRKGPATAR